MPAHRSLVLQAKEGHGIIYYMSYLSLVLALLSAIAASFVAIFGKIGLKDIDSNTATAIRAIVMAVFLVIVIAIQGKFNHIEPILQNHKALLFIVLSGIAGATSWLFYFWALKIGKTSQIVPIDKLSVVFAIILAMIILGEHVSLKAGIGVVIMVIGSILIALG